MARFRHAAGFSQGSLAAGIGITYRMVAYYEKETEHPPTHLLPLLSKALGVSADELLGLEKPQEIMARQEVSSTEKYFKKHLESEEFRRSYLEEKVKLDIEYRLEELKRDIRDQKSPEELIEKVEAIERFVMSV